MRPDTLHVGGTLYWVIRTRDPDTLILKDADATPTVAVRKNGASTGDSVTINKRSATTGLYDCSYNPAAEVEGDVFELEEQVQVTGTTTAQAYYDSGFSVKVVAVERGTDSAALASGVNVTQLGGDTQSLTDLKDFADAGYDPSTNKVQGVVLVDTTTTLTNLPAITTNWLTAAGIATDAITEIQNGLATAANLALIPVDGTLTVTLANGVTHGGSTAMLRLGSSTTTPAFYVVNSSSDDNAHAVYFKAGSSMTGGAGLLIDGGSLQTTFIAPAVEGLYAGGDSVAHEGEIIAIKAKTDNLPSDPADASDIASSFSTVNSTLSTIAAYIDTEVAAIKAKTDNLPSDPADASDIAASFSSIASTLATIAAYIDTEVAAIKAKTDNLPSDPADQSAVEAAITAATSPLATAANLATVAGYLDTEIAAILSDTNELQTDWANGGRLDLILDAAGSAGDPWVTILPGSYTGSQAGKVLSDILGDTAELQTDWVNGGRLDLILDARSSQSSVDDLPTNSELSTALGTADDAVLSAINTLQTSVNTIDDFVDTEITAIKAKTDLLVTFPTNFSSLGINASGHISRVVLVDTTTTNADLVSAATIATTILTTQMTESYSADGVAPTLAQALFLMQQAFTEFVITGTGISVKKLDGVTEAAGYTMDSATTPTQRLRTS